MVSLSWKEVRALSLLMVPLLTSSSPAAARPDENIRLSIPQREALHAARLNERNLRHQSIYESGGWRQVRNSVEISSRRGFEASPTGVPVVNLRPDVINRHIFRGVSRGGFPQLAQTNLGNSNLIPDLRLPRVLNLDLTSDQKSIALPARFFRGQSWVSVNVGGETKTFTEGALVTPAEYVAISQTMGGDTQSLFLNKNGTASGGQFSLSMLRQPQSYRNISTLVIPEQVVALDDLSRGALKISGDIVNRGQIVGMSSPSRHDGKIFADNVLNLAGAIISMDSLINANGLDSTAPGFMAKLASIADGARSAGNLLIRASEKLTNDGTIFSTGNLTVSAAEIRNTGLMMSGNSLAVETQKLVNTGVVKTMGALLQLSTGDAVGGLSVESTGGTFEANRGNIRIAATGPIDLIGGVLNAQLVKFSSPDSIVSVAAQAISGLVDVAAFSSAVHVEKGDLAINSINVAGDPIFTNSAGSIILPANITASGAPVTAVAFGDIIGANGGTLIDTSSMTDNGGDVTLLAGVNNVTAGGVTTVSGPSGSNGSIYGITGIKASGADNNSTGGNIVLGAFGGSINITGAIEASARSAGHVTLLAPGDIKLGDVNTRGQHAQEDYITIRTVNPSLGSGLTFDSNGKLTQGTVGMSSIVGNGSIVAGNLESGNRNNSSANAGNINILAGGSISTGYLRTMGSGAAPRGFALQGYDYASNGGDGGDISVVSKTGGILIDGDINSSGGGGGGANHTAGGRGGDGGNVLLTAIADVIINGPVLAPGGGGGGGVGISSTDTGGGGGSLGNGGGPNSGGIFFSPAPYDGPGRLDNGLNLHNPNRHRFPWPGMGGSNTAYDIGCCGSGFGGAVGEPGENGDQGTFAPRGNWNDTSPKPGGAPGFGGDITITGRDISVTKTIGTFYDKRTIPKSPYVDYSVFTYSKTGTGTVNLTTTSGSVVTTVYSSNSDLESTTADVTAQLRSGQVTLAGKMRGSQVNMNGVALPTIVLPGVLPGAANASLQITENGSTKTISNGDLVTSSEWIALIQKATTGVQDLALGAGGASNSGKFDISSANIPASGFTSLVIPTNVTGAVKTAVVNATTSNIKGILHFDNDGAVNSNNLSVTGKIEAPNKTLTINASQVNLGGGSKITAGNVDINGSTINTATSGVATIDSTNGATVGLTGQAVSFSNTSGGSSTIRFTGGPLDIIGSTFSNGSNSNLLFNSKATISLTGQLFQNNGVIVANDSDGNGGDLSIMSSSTNFTVNSGSLSVVPTAVGGGHGGSLAIAAELASLSLSSSVLDGSASGSGNFNGGSVSVLAKTLSVPGAGLTISANGVGSGDGGFVSVVTTGAGSNLIVDGSSGNLKISAHGGSAGSSSGAGGGVKLSSGGNLTVNANAIDLVPRGTNGDGAQYDFEAGTASSGALVFSGAINADGIGSGSGGSIKAVTNSANPLIVGTGSANGISGKLSANGGAISGAGGTIWLENTSGGISFADISSISAKAGKGNGGFLTLLSQNGPVSIPSGIYSFDGAGTNGDGGGVYITAGHMNVAAGGAKFSANGAGNGSGGSMSLVVNDSQDLTIGTSFITMSATGGSTNSSAGSGGKILVSSGGDLVIEQNALTAGLLGNAGVGASYSLTAGTASPGRLLINGSLDSSGKGNGASGNVDLQFTDAQTFMVGGSGLQNGITGSILALGAGSGSDGKVSITNHSNKLTVDVNSSLLAGELHFSSLDDVTVSSNGSMSGKISAEGKGISILNNTSALRTGTIAAGVDGVSLTASGKIDVEGAIVSAGDVTLNASGDLRVFNSISSDTSAKLSALGASSVLFNNGGAVTAPVVSVKTVDGDIVSASTATVLNASSLSLESTTGDIGNASTSLFVSADNLSANTGGAGVVSINSVGANPLVLGDSSSGGNFALQASGPVTLNDIVSDAGGVQVTTIAGKLYVAPNATITAGDGSITIQNNDFSGSLAIGANSTIRATSGTSGEGNVYIGFGAQPSVFPKPRKKYKNIELLPTNGGGIFVDRAGLKAASPINTFTADGKTIFFTNKSKKKQTAIVIEGNVNISALQAGSSLMSNSASLLTLAKH